MSEKKNVFVYNKSGKLIDKHAYINEDEKAVPIAYTTTVITNNEPHKSTKEKIESETIPANFSGGNEAYRKLIIDNFDPSSIETEGLIMFELHLTIDTDGTVSLENRQQKIYSDKDLSDEMNRVFRRLPKWNPATQNGIPVN